MNSPIVVTKMVENAQRGQVSSDANDMTALHAAESFKASCDDSNFRTTDRRPSLPSARVGRGRNKPDPGTRPCNAEGVQIWARLGPNHDSNVWEFPLAGQTVSAFSAATRSGGVTCMADDSASRCSNGPLAPIVGRQ